MLTLLLAVAVQAKNNFKKQACIMLKSRSKLFNKTGSMDGADNLLIQLGVPVRRTVIVSCEGDLVSI